MAPLCCNMEERTCRHCGESLTLGELVRCGTDLHADCMEELLD